MIVPMKKAAIIVQAKDSQSAVGDLRALGVMHIEHQKPPSGRDIVSLKDDIATLEKVINILSSPEIVAKSGLRGAKLVKDWRFTAKHVVDTFTRIDHLEEYSRSLTTRIVEWEIWGDFDPQSVSSLQDKGVYLRFYEIPVKEINGLPAGMIVKQVAISKGLAYCAIISREKTAIGYKEIIPPKSSLSDMKARLAENSSIIGTLKATLRMYTCYLNRFLEIRKAFLRELELHEAFRGMGEAGQISYMVGYVPYDRAASLAEMAKSRKWGISVKDPSGEDAVPTLVRNPRWISIISPIFKLLEIVPGYRELDISPVFLLFLSLFFGMIIGDAGYGALYILLTFLAQIKLGKKLTDHRVFFLFYLFSSSAVLWGLLTGTVFGQEWYLSAGLKPLAPVLNDTRFLQAFCFFLGALHLTIGHLWQAIRKLPSLTAMADAGWISVIWAAFLLARMLILNYPLPPFTRWLIIGGVTLVIFGSSPQRNIFKMVAEGLGAVALSIMNNFTDVVSYVRLFAVGLAGVAISDTVNSLAASLGANIAAKLFVLFIGHTINIVLGPMSVLVHGIRLNVLEFSGHAGLTWTGIQYKPLEK